MVVMAVCKQTVTKQQQMYRRGVVANRRAVRADARRAGINAKTTLTHIHA